MKNSSLYGPLKAVFVLMILLGIILPACSGSDDPEPIPDKIEVSQASFQVEQEGGTLTLDVTTNQAWNVIVDAASWLSVSSTSGAAGNFSLAITVAENSQKEMRSGTLTISAGTASKIITISQKAYTPAIRPSISEVAVGSEGGSVEVEIRSNIDYEVVLPEGGWITEQTLRAFSTDFHTFVVAKNESYDGRKAQIQFLNKEKGVTASLTINQKQKDMLVVTKDTYEIPAEGGLFELAVQTNVDFSVVSSADWLRQDTSRGLTDQVLKFGVDSNERKEARSATLTLKSESGLTQTVTVTQQGMFIPEGGNIDDMPVEEW